MLIISNTYNYKYKKHTNDFLPYLVNMNLFDLNKNLNYIIIPFINTIISLIIISLNSSIEIIFTSIFLFKLSNFIYYFLYLKYNLKEKNNTIILLYNL